MSNNYMALVNHCMHIITTTPGGVSWLRLLERVNALGGASRREKAQVFKYLKDRPTLWDNDADDMTNTIFMLRTEAPTEDAVSEASTTKVSATASAKKERLAKYGSTGVSKVSKVVAPTKPEPVAEKPEVLTMNDRVVRLPTSKTGIVFGDNNLIDEDDVMMEMAWHVYESGEHGMTISSLRMSVPEYSDCDEADRRYLVKQMSQRFGIGLYERTAVDGERVIKVLCRRGGSYYNLERPDWFIKQGRKPFKFSSAMLNEVKPQVATFGQVAGNTMFDQLAALKATTLFNQNAGTEVDEFDEDDDNTGMEVEGHIHTTPADPRDVVSVPASKPVLPEVKAVSNPTSPANAYHTTPADKEEVKPLPPELQKTYDNLVETRGAAKVNVPVAEVKGGVSKAEVTQAADTLRLIAAQLEAQAGNNEAIRQKKERFDVLMRMARESSVQIQTALDAHNELLDDLQKAANDLTSL